MGSPTRRPGFDGFRNSRRVFRRTIRRRDRSVTNRRVADGSRSARRLREVWRVRLIHPGVPSTDYVLERRQWRHRLLIPTGGPGSAMSTSCSTSTSTRSSPPRRRTGRVHCPGRGPTTNTMVRVRCSVRPHDRGRHRDLVDATPRRHGDRRASSTDGGRHHERTRAGKRRPISDDHHHHESALSAWPLVVFDNTSFPNRKGVFADADPSTPSHYRTGWVRAPGYTDDRQDIVPLGTVRRSFR